MKKYFEIQRNANGIFLGIDDEKIQLLHSHLSIYSDHYSVGIAFLASTVEKVWLFEAQSYPGASDGYLESVLHILKAYYVDTVRFQNLEGHKSNDDPLYREIKNEKLCNRLGSYNDPCTPMHVISQFRYLRRSETPLDTSACIGWEQKRELIERGINARDIPAGGYALALGIKYVAQPNYYRSFSTSKVYW